MSIPALLLGMVHRHFKGGRYVPLLAARSTVDTTEVVVYMSLETGEYWSRPGIEWSQPVDWPDGVSRSRFVREDYLLLPSLLLLWARAPKKE